MFDQMFEFTKEIFNGKTFLCSVSRQNSNEMKFQMIYQET